MTLQDWAWGYSRAFSNQQALEEELLDFHDNDSILVTVGPAVAVLSTFALSSVMLKLGAAAKHMDSGALPCSSSLSPVGLRPQGDFPSQISVLI